MNIQLADKVTGQEPRPLASGNPARTIMLMALVFACVCAHPQPMAGRRSRAGPPVIRGARLVPCEVPTDPNDGWEAIRGLPWFNDRTLVLMGVGWGEYNYHIDLVDVLARHITNITALFHLRRLPSEKALGRIYAGGDGKYVIVDGLGRATDVPQRRWWQFDYPDTPAEYAFTLGGGKHRVFQLDVVRQPSDLRLDVGDLTHSRWSHRYRVSAPIDPNLISPESFAASGDTCTKTDWSQQPGNPTLSIDSWTVRGRKLMHTHWAELFPKATPCDSDLAAASGDGKWLAWYGTARTAHGKLISPPTSRIWCCSASHRQPVVMCTLPARDDGSNQLLSWSPSGARLAFFFDDRPYVTENPLMAGNAQARARVRSATQAAHGTSRRHTGRRSPPAARSLAPGHQFGGPPHRPVL